MSEAELQLDVKENKQALLSLVFSSATNTVSSP